ncbi:histidine phosphatase family protein [Paenibacillus amylolyticus]|nr:histidine phosphatase family protein [Paenibacillus amylolyticus]
MKSIYLIRHAKATGQEPHAELTNEGIRQAEKLADILAHHSITYIVSSPWKRAISDRYATRHSNAATYTYR